MLTTKPSLRKPSTSSKEALTVSSASEMTLNTCWLVRNAKITPTLDGMGKEKTWSEGDQFIKDQILLQLKDTTG